MEPQQKAGQIAFSNINPTGATITFTPGSGSGSLVIIKDGATPNTPVDGKSYNANALKTDR